MIQNNMTVGYLMKFISDNNLPDDKLVYVERIQDVYFEKHGWSKTSVFKEGQMYSEHIRLLNKIKSGYFNKEEFPKITEEWKQQILDIPQEEIDELKTEYHNIWCPVKYEDDNNLYLDLHY